MLVLLLALFEAVAAADAAAPPAGVLCIGATESMLTRGSCRDVKGTSFAIEPGDRERLFLWTSADKSTAQIGVAPAKSTVIDLRAGRLSDVHASITAPRGWPSDTKIAVIGTNRWEWEPSEKLRLLVVPRGLYSIRVEARHHRVAGIRRVDANADGVKHDPIALQPLPRANGRVVDKDNVPVPGAQVSFADGTVCTVADVQGEFSCELTPGPRREPLVISSGGFAAVEIPVEPGFSRDLDLGVIRLLPGRRLIVNITKPDDLMTMKVTLLYDSPKEFEHTRMRTVELPAGENEVRFNEVTTGTYYLLLQGAEPLERLLVPVEIEGEETVTKKIAIEPFLLEGTARLGDDLIDGQVSITGPQMSWRETLPIKDGRFEATMWQSGHASGILKSPALPHDEFVNAPSLGQSPSKWDIRIERRIISGRVFDADTKASVRDASMELVAELDGGRSYRSVQLAGDGTFEILASRPGLYTLKVTSPDHAASATEVKVGPEDKSRSVEIPLQAGVEQALEIVTPAGTPVPSFIVLEGVQSDRINPQFMMPGTNGRFTLRGAPAERRLIYIVPRDGSFGVVRLQMPSRGATAKPMQVVIAPAVGALRVRTTDPDDQPVPAGILIRYNGEFLPPAIARFVTGKFVGTPPSGEAVIAKLPAGTYELWALSSSTEEEPIMASGGSLRSPTRVGLSGGEQTVALVAPHRPASPER